MNPPSEKGAEPGNRRAEEANAHMVAACPVTVKLDPEALALLQQIRDLLDYQGDLLAAIHAELQGIKVAMHL
jgi:hypothetical protein